MIFAICCSIALAVVSQEVFESTSRIFEILSKRSTSDQRKARSQAAIKSACVSPRCTICPYGSATSVIGVLTMGRSAAMYSRVLVGLMKRVASLRANGSRHTSHPVRYCGSSA